MFDQAIAGIMWPGSIRQLTFGEFFDQPLGVLPKSLEELTFGRYFNQPIQGVKWPAALHTLSFGDVQSDQWLGGDVLPLSNFDQAIDGSTWPTSLQRLSIGGVFGQSFQRLGTWMPGLQELSVLLVDTWAYGELLRGIEWPKGLRTLTVLSDAVLEEIGVPPTVEIAYIVRNQ